MQVDQETANRFLIIIGCVAFFGPLLLWPITALTLWSNQPQGVMALSWVAIILTGAVLLLGAITKRDIDS